MGLSLSACPIALTILHLHHIEFPLVGQLPLPFRFHCISSLLLDDTRRHWQFAANGGGSRNMSKCRTVCRGQPPLLHLNHVYVASVPIVVRFQFLEYFSPGESTVLTFQSCHCVSVAQLSVDYVVKHVVRLVVVSFFSF